MRFRHLVTPTLIQIAYWALNIGVALLALFQWESNFLLALVIFIAGLVIVRVIAEMPMLAFRVSGTITDIRNATVEETTVRASTAHGGGSPSSFTDFMTFRRMIIPRLITMVWFILTGFAILLYIAFSLAFFEGVHGKPFFQGTLGLGPMDFVGITIGWIIGVLSVRIIAEVLSLAFGINEDLTDVRNAIRAAGTASVASGGAKLDVMDFLTFRRMVTPILIQAFFWLGTLVVIILAIFLFSLVGGVVGLLLMVMVLGLGLLFVRCFSEMSIVQFMINETLTDIRKLTVRQKGATSSNTTHTIGEFLTFRHMIAPILIQVLYWIITVGVVVAFVSNFESSNAILMVAVLVCAFLIVRIYAEAVLVIFRINETLTDIRNVSVRQTGTTERSSNDDPITDFLTFRRMVTPILIQAFYWLLTAGVVVISVQWAQSSGFLEDGPVRILAVGVLLVVGLLAVRVYTELILLMFRINETLTDIRNAPIPLAGAARTELTPQADTASQAPPPPLPRSRSPRVVRPTTKACPHCEESIPREEIKCRHCGGEVPNEPESSGQ